MRETETPPDPEVFPNQTELARQHSEALAATACSWNALVPRAVSTELFMSSEFRI